MILGKQCWGTLKEFPWKRPVQARSPDIKFHYLHGKSASEWGPIMKKIKKLGEEAGFDTTCI